MGPEGSVPTVVTVLLFGLYSASGFTAAAAALLRPLPLISPGSPAAALLRAGGVAGLFLLGFGTGLDNARTLAGAFPASVPPGVFELRNTSRAQHISQDAIDSNYAVSWFCFVAHECLGSTFLLPGIYLWAAARKLEAKQDRCLPKCPCTTWVNRFLKTDAAICRLGFALALVGVSIGCVGFATHTATERLVLRYNQELDIWKWGSGNKNPNGLVGVFLSSYVWIAVGLLIWQHRGLRWFACVQLVAFAGQGVSGALPKDFLEMPSNFFEQVVTWALLILGWQLQGMIARGERDDGLLPANTA